MLSESFIKDVDKAVKGIKFAEDLYEKSTFDDEVVFCDIKYSIHVYSGIEKLAEAFNSKLKLKNRDDSDYPYEKYFTIRGITLFQLYSEKDFKEGK